MKGSKKVRPLIVLNGWIVQYLLNLHVIITRYQNYHPINFWTRGQQNTSSNQCIEYKLVNFENILGSMKLLIIDNWLLLNKKSNWLLLMYEFWSVSKFQEFFETCKCTNL